MADEPEPRGRGYRLRVTFNGRTLIKLEVPVGVDAKTGQRVIGPIRREK
jgi:hypothetical protein